MRASVVSSTVAGLLSLATTGAAQALELKLADTMPAGHTIHQAVTALLMKEVEQASQGKVTLKHFPGGQLGKGTDTLRLVQSGLQDIGMISPALVSDKMPLTAVSELPGLWTRACQAALALWTLSRDGAILHEREFKPNGIRALAFFPLPGYQLMVSSGRQVSSLKDVEGLKIRAAGGALERIVRSLNGAPVRMSAPEMYEAMSRGTIDGALFSYQAATSYKLDKLIKVSTQGQNFGTIVNGYFISDKKWNGLPEPTRKMIAAAGEKATKDGCRGLDDAEEKAKAQLQAAGTRYISLSATEQQLVDRSSDEVRQAWVSALEGRGVPAAQVLKAFTDAVR